MSAVARRERVHLFTRDRLHAGTVDVDLEDNVWPDAIRFAGHVYARRDGVYVDVTAVNGAPVILALDEPG